MPFSVVPGNYLLQLASKAIQAILNTGAACRLFSNDVQPDPSFAVLQFAESSFPGYARWNLNGVWNPPLKVKDGEYVTGSSPHTWTCTGPSNNTVYGWYIVKDNKVLASARFLAPYLMGTGVTINLGIAIEDLYEPGL